MSEQVRGHVPDRRKHTFWFDPRFAIGLVLIAASVVGVVVVIGANDSSVEVLATRDALAPGQTVNGDDLRTVQVRVGDADELYLLAEDVPDEGIVVTRAVGAGELLAVSAVGNMEAIELTTVVLQLTSRLPEAVGEGARLDIWAARTSTAGEFEAPSVIVSSATVVRLITDDALMGGSSAGSLVEVLIARSAVASVLESVANSAALSAIPVDLAVRE